MQENPREYLDRVEANFKTAMTEFTRQSGYVEGTLDTVISMMMDASPEISLTSDRLIKTFHSMEGICQQGLSSEFQSLLDFCRSLLDKESTTDKKVESETDLNLDLDAAVELLSKAQQKSKKGSNGK